MKLMLIHEGEFVLEVEPIIIPSKEPVNKYVFINYHPDGNKIYLGAINAVTYALKDEPTHHAYCLDQFIDEDYPVNLRFIDDVHWLCLFGKNAYSELCVVGENSYFNLSNCLKIRSIVESGSSYSGFNKAVQQTTVKKCGYEYGPGHYLFLFKKTGLKQEYLECWDEFPNEYIPEFGEADAALEELK